jgi:hypothetical protein
MTKLVVMVLFISIFVSSCEDRSFVNAQPDSAPSSEGMGNPSQVESLESEVWVPTIIEECLAKYSPPEPVEIEDTFNPYYLRADLSGNATYDVIVLVRSTSDKRKRGILICRSNKEAFLYGSIAKSAIQFSDMSNDNFVTSRWEVLTHEETKAVKRDDTGQPIGHDAKGESILFVFEGGGFVVYWDGKNFKGIGGA